MKARIKSFFKKDAPTADREHPTTGEAESDGVLTAATAESSTRQPTHTAELAPHPPMSRPAPALAALASPSPFARPPQQAQCSPSSPRHKQVTGVSASRARSTKRENTELTTFEERNSFLGPGRRGSMELEELPAVAYLAQAEFTRAVSRNIKSIVQARAAFASSSIPNSPSGSELGNPPRSPSCRTSANPYVNRCRTSAMRATDGAGPPSEVGSSALAREAQWLALSSPLASLDAGRILRRNGNAGPTDDEDEGPLPNVVPQALLLEAGAAGVDLEMDLEADIVITPNTPPLGQGVSGTVYKGTYRGVACAVKLLALNRPTVIVGRLAVAKAWASPA
ncbi:hypothetical protein TSOC_000391 [Tetrabaena socialis]|uniref:Protein kinase domain-containing protein n=1 Tax=Tetrabaena socialis TaxID=47790 RepID=A0A2J8AJM4_9CHLO|nr:hypothetical protein TSOC_000391 [Tetrabaena socialis]|eukprot:PNH12714.1 hypothetical protein TSOC_000391 [Tetrabaena socialis]